MNFLLNAALSLVIRWLSNSEINKVQIEEIKTFIRDLEGRAIDNVVKHEATASLIKSFAHNLSNTAIDAIIKLLLLKVRGNA